MLYLSTARETDYLLSAQNNLIGKLKEECHILGEKLEELTQDSRHVALFLLSDLLYLTDIAMDGQ